MCLGLPGMGLGFPEMALADTTKGDRLLPQRGRSTRETPERANKWVFDRCRDPGGWFPGLVWPFRRLKAGSEGCFGCSEGLGGRSGVFLTRSVGFGVVQTHLGSGAIIFGAGLRAFWFGVVIAC